MYVIRQPEEDSFSKVGITGRIFPMRELTDAVSIVRISTETGHETEIIEHGSVFAYYVLSGEGRFIVEGVPETCAAGDLVVIPPGRRFTYKGNLQMLLVCTPPWKEEQEETVGAA